MEVQKHHLRRIPEDMVKVCVFRILDAMIYLHRNQIAHRDLKLANILLNDDFEIKLADFGLSKEYSQGKMLETICGTPLTMAPEIL